MYYRDSSPKAHFGSRKKFKSHCWRTWGLYYAKTQKNRAGERNSTNYTITV